MKNGLRITTVIIMALVLLFGIGVFMPRVFAADASENEGEEPQVDPEESIRASIEESIRASIEAEEASKRASSEEASRQSSEEASKKASEEESSKEASSIAESASIAESEEQSRQASIAASQSEAISLSESASVEEAIRTIELAGCKVRVHLNNVAVPDGFMLAKDTTTFGEEVEAFYSTNYHIYVFYASENDIFSYYVYDKLHDKMFPYVTLSDPKGNQLICTVPSSTNELVGTYKSDINVTFKGANGQTLAVPGWLVYDKELNETAVIYLTDREGKSGFYVYQNVNGAISLLPWDEYEAKLDETEEETETTEAETTTEAVVTEIGTSETEAPEEERSFLDDYLIWIIIIAVIIVLIIAAIIVVFFMSKKQEAEEGALGFEADEEDREKLPRYDSSYSNQSKYDPDPFDYSFENSFPDEMEVEAEKEPAEDDPIDTTYNTVMFTEEDKAFLNGNRPVSERIRDTRPAAKAEAENHRKAFDESLEDEDFEVVDFGSDRKK